MMRRYRLLLLGIAAYLLFLLMLFPATTAWTLFASQELPLQLNGLSGSIWRGNANQVAWRGKALGSLHWDWRFLSLFLGRLGADFSLQTSGGYLQGEVEAPLSLSAVHLAALEGQMPVTEVMHLAPPMPIPVVAVGTVSLGIPQLDLDMATYAVRASGRINWHGAEVLSPQAFALGNLQADITTDDKGVVSAQLKDLGGPLKLDAQLRLMPDRNYKLSGTVAATRNAEPSVQQALSWLGKVDGSGRHRLDLAGRL